MPSPLKPGCTRCSVCRLRGIEPICRYGGMTALPKGLTTESQRHREDKDGETREWVGWVESSRPTTGCLRLPVGLEDSTHPTFFPPSLSSLCLCASVVSSIYSVPRRACSRSMASNRALKLPL